MSADVDDWFESASQVSSSREILPWKADEHTLVSANTNPFRQAYFQPIKNNNNVIRERSPKPPTIITDDEKNIMKSRSPRMSESDVFVRTPSPPHHSEFTRNTRSPPTTNRQSNTLTVNNQQRSNDSNGNFFS